jgi:hypothetical protein
MSVLAAAPVPFLAAVTVIALALLAVIARAVSPPPTGPHADYAPSWQY